MKHPVRHLFEKFGLVRKAGETEERYAETDKVLQESKAAAAEARARRERLALEVPVRRKVHR